MPPLETDKLSLAARVDAIQRELDAIDGPVVLVAHSAGVLMTVHWAARHSRPILGALLERDGPGSLGTHLATLADGALVDSRVLLAHRSGADEGGWPPAEDRFASDLLIPDAVADPWLRDLTRAAF